MRYLVRIALAACITTAIAAQAQTAAPQQPAAVPEKMPFDGQRMIYGGFEVIVDA